MHVSRGFIKALRKETKHVCREKEAISHVFGDNAARTIRTISCHAKMASSGLSRIICGLVEVYSLNYDSKYHLVTMIPSRLQHVGNCSSVAFIYLALISPWKSLEKNHLSKIGTKTERSRWKTSSQPLGSAKLQRTTSEWPRLVIPSEISPKLALSSALEINWISDIYSCRK